MFSNVGYLAMSQSILGSCAKCFKQKKDSFLFSQIKTLKTAYLKRTKKCFIFTEIAKKVIEISDQTLINQYLQKRSAKITSGLHIMAANKMLNSYLPSPNSVYNGMCT